MKTKNYTRLTYKDRVQIEILFHSNFSVSEIALKLKRTKSTISREIKRGLPYQEKVIVPIVLNGTLIFTVELRKLIPGLERTRSSGSICLAALN
jgi:hypoxanthine-guanine phosphoribosyltransferase